MGLTVPNPDLLERGDPLATPPQRRRRLWALAFYAPALALPMASRVLVLVRDGADLGLASAVKGGAFGAMQDAAVLLQTLVAVRLVMYTSQLASRWLPRALVHTVASLLLSVLYAWLTLACALDFTLLVRFLPRLNRGFVQMYLRFSSQFASSLEDVVTPQLVLGVVFYVLSMVLWVTSVVADKVHLPRFSLLVCETTGSDGPSATTTKPAPMPRQRRASVAVQEAGMLPYAIHFVTTSVALRTIFVALLVSASALHATLALDGNGHDIYLLSNAMFSLETEDLLRAAASQSRAAGTGATLQHQHALMRGITHGHADTNLTDFTTADNATDDDETRAPLNPFYDRTLGRTELFELASEHENEFPFWRTTRKYTGKKRFAWTSPSSSDKPPPTVLMINLESFRSLEVGVLGGRAKMKQFNQTVTPFFDALSQSGILFAKHYTPCVQTSRTLLSGIFGILPSLADASAVSTFADSKLRLYGLPQILKKAFNYTSTFWSAVNLSWEDWAGFLRTNGFDTLVDDTVVLDHLTKAQRDALTDDDAFSWGRHDAVSFDALTNFLRLHQPRRGGAWATPLFMDVYTVSSHDPWKVPATFVPSTNYSQYLTTDNEKYVHALNYVDQCLEKFITTLRREKLLDNTILLIQGDHGYGRMEHENNPTIVASWVYDVGTHVPMLLVADDLLDDKDKGLVVDEITSQTDMLATITDLLGIQDFQQHGVGLSMLREQSPDREVVLSNPFYGQTRGLRVRDLKYARYGSGKYEVYNLTSDPLELAPVEAGKLAKNADGGVHIGADLSATTAEELRYIEEIEDVVSLLYETNGFMPSPQVLALESSAMGVDETKDARRKKILEVVHHKTTEEPTKKEEGDKKDDKDKTKEEEDKKDEKDEKKEEGDKKDEKEETAAPVEAAGGNV